MSKVKILKKPRKSKKIDKSLIVTGKVKRTMPMQDKYANKYLAFYDDIKVPSKRYDW